MKHSNNAKAILTNTTPYSTTATQITLPSGKGALFGDSFPYTVTYEFSDPNGVVLEREVMNVTNRSWDTLTVQRAYEYCPKSDTSNTQVKQAVQLKKWGIIEMRITGGWMEEIESELNTIEQNKADRSRTPYKDEDAQITGNWLFNKSPLYNDISDLPDNYNLDDAKNLKAGRYRVYNPTNWPISWLCHLFVDGTITDKTFIFRSLWYYNTANQWYIRTHIWWYSTWEKLGWGISGIIWDPPYAEWYIKLWTIDFVSRSNVFEITIVGWNWYNWQDVQNQVLRVMWKAWNNDSEWIGLSWFRYWWDNIFPKEFILKKIGTYTYDVIIKKGNWYSPIWATYSITYTPWIKFVESINLNYPNPWAENSPNVCYTSIVDLKEFDKSPVYISSATVTRTSQWTSYVAIPSGANVAIVEISWNYSNFGNFVLTQQATKWYWGNCNSEWSGSNINCNMGNTSSNENATFKIYFYRNL